MEKVKNKKKETPKEKDTLLTALLIILLITSIILVVLKIVNGTVLENDDKKVTELHNYFNPEVLINCDGLYNYADKLVDYKGLNNDNKMCLAYQKIDTKNSESIEYKLDAKDKVICTQDDMVFRAEDEADKCIVNKVDKKELNAVYKKIFGKDVEDVKEFKVDNYHICYNKEDAYYCGLSETYTYSIGNESIVYRVLNRVVEKGGEIVIQDYFLKTTGESCYNSYTATATDQKCTSEYKKSKEIDTDFMLKYGKAYKHVFKKAKDGTYYWVSSEPTEVKK